MNEFELGKNYEALDGFITFTKSAGELQDLSDKMFILNNALSVMDSDETEELYQALDLVKSFNSELTDKDIENMAEYRGELYNRLEKTSPEVDKNDRIQVVSDLQEATKALAHEPENAERKQKFEALKHQIEVWLKIAKQED